MSNIKISLAAWSDAAGRPNNEDSFIVCRDISAGEWTFTTGETVPLGKRGALLVVCDGMGGANAGEVASALAVETIKECFSEDALTDKTVASTESAQNFVADAIRRADKKIRETADTDSEKAGMGSTIVLAWLLGNEIHVGWCGDSRVYRYNPTFGIERLSHDHSFVQSLVDAGRLTEEMARQHPDSNIITRCLGGGQETSEPEVRTFPLYRGDVLLLCTDGLCGLMSDRETEVVIEQHSCEPRACRDALLAESKQKGWTDNVTLAICRIVAGGAKPPQKATKRRFPRTILLVILAAVLLFIAFEGGYFLASRRFYPPPEFLPADTTVVQPQDSVLIKPDSIQTDTVPNIKPTTKKPEVPRKTVESTPDTGLTPIKDDTMGEEVQEQKQS